ncbi:ankyrin repeat domain-containing protein [Streptomyces sp. NPDC096198]|uniref:ankyrin repeat domain-containing protein n=1 Tax=Streptomyces sp. NPDC096198 TaxID=3366080 RepID=UPI00381E62C4
MSTQEPPELIAAVYDEDETAVLRLLRAGADPETADGEGETALYRAAVNGAAGIVRLLLQAGADPDRLSSGSDLPLCGAASWGHTEAVRALLAAGAAPDLAEEYGYRALIWAARGGHEADLRALLAAGADPDLPGPDGAPPLVAAARRGSPGCVRALLEHGARGRREALAEARRRLTVDIEADLRKGLETGTPGCAYITDRREDEPGTTTVEVTVVHRGLPAVGDSGQTGHRAIAALLEAETEAEAG